ncbi:MAG: hypothetical protein WD225_08585, partial [Ilumatobacteraceae bacterium]
MTPDMTEVTEHPDPADDPLEPAPPWWRRAGERAVRRPVAWARRDWPADRVVTVSFTAFALICTTAIMMNVVHLNPLLPG